jgi:hypothetical protein
LAEVKPDINAKIPIAELDQLDLLGGESTPGKSEVDISTFSARIQKRFEEQKEVQKREDDGARIRQFFLLSSLLRARKILKGVSQLKLGNNVDLQIVCDDFQGWPRILIEPNHAKDDLIELSSFEVTGSERQGVVELTMRIPGTSFKEELIISKQEDLQRVTRILKRNIRLYLDQLTDEIIKPRYRDSGKVAADEVPVKALNEGQALKEVDLFEDHSGGEVLDTLPQLEDIQSLDGLE